MRVVLIEEQLRRHRAGRHILYRRWNASGAENSEFSVSPRIVIDISRVLIGGRVGGE